MWYDWIIVGAGAVALIRLLLMFGGDMSANDKLSKSSNWIIGVILFSVSWAIIRFLFGVDMGNFNGGNATTNKTAQEQYYNPNTNETSIKIKIGDEDE